MLKLTRIAPSICLVFVMDAVLGIHSAPASAKQSHDERDPLRPRLDAVVKAYSRDRAFMGTVLVAQGDCMLLDKGYGQADIEWDIPNAPGTKFHIGSVTKQFTAGLILLLQQDGKLAVRNHVSDYLPGLPMAWRDITVAELLTQTSGIFDYARDPDFPVWSQTPQSRAAQLARISKWDLLFKPGSQFNYSSSNYELLGQIAEKVGGKPYGELLRTYIFNPLGMRDSGLDTDELVLARRAQGYRVAMKGSLTRPRAGSLTVPWAAGSIYSTTGDLLKWERGLFNGRLLSIASLRALTTPGLGDYGMGVAVRTDAHGLKVIEHGGALEGFHSYLSYVPERQLTVAVLGNVETLTPDAIAADLVSLALEKPSSTSSNVKLSCGKR